ncbi:hypothetical protein CYMTET_44359 [Cymbomonas tetramitiformis]|uniref:Uncharacterized protein n=1 Tax=Cymbomonas tetramitiformis TaxID=36881 RepID=A0AAE0C1P3_9CHLO|nr:hypothetical protein CYMTET_44359 [Cymbomonas tetramitiformis]
MKNYKNDWSFVSSLGSKIVMVPEAMDPYRNRNIRMPYIPFNVAERLPRPSRVVLYYANQIWEYDHLHAPFCKFLVENKIFEDFFGDESAEHDSDVILRIKKLPCDCRIFTPRLFSIFSETIDEAKALEIYEDMLYNNSISNKDFEDNRICRAFRRFDLLERAFIHLIDTGKYEVSRRMLLQNEKTLKRFYITKPVHRRLLRACVSKAEEAYTLSDSLILHIFGEKAENLWSTDKQKDIVICEYLGTDDYCEQKLEAYMEEALKLSTPSAEVTRHVCGLARKSRPCVDRLALILKKGFLSNVNINLLLKYGDEEMKREAEQKYKERPHMKQHEEALAKALAA